MQLSCVVFCHTLQVTLILHTVTFLCVPNLTYKAKHEPVDWKAIINIIIMYTSAIT